MSVSALLLSCVFLWSIFALIVHIALPQTADKIRRAAQTSLILVWLVLIVSLLVINRQTIVIMLGGWVAPFGIALVTDQLSQVMMVVFALVAMCVSFYSYWDQAIVNRQKGFYAGFWLLLLGVSGAVFTADIFNLYVWFEVILVSAFILLASGDQSKPHAMMHYALMNITGTLLMLLAIALLYGAFGSLSYAEIANQLIQVQHPSILPILCLLLFAIGLKGAVFPLYFWLPKAYPKPSHSSMMLLSSLVTKTVMVVLLRLVWLWSPLRGPFFTHSLVFVALATMFFGVLGAASQFRFKDILAFHIVSQLGYIVLAIVLPSALAIIAAVYFIIHNVFVKTNLLMVASIIEQHHGSDGFKKLGQMLKQHNYLSVVFFLAAMSLAGFPPLSGFWGKLFIIKSALDTHFYISAAVAIIVSLFTLYSMIKIWRYVFCEKGQTSCGKPLMLSIYVIIAIAPLLLLPILMGLWPDGILTCLKPISVQLQHPEHYIHLVLRGRS
ncbi:MAG: proton-conducting transporter membrane subunit [Pseudomonadota bacterium]